MKQNRDVTVRGKKLVFLVLDFSHEEFPRGEKTERKKGEKRTELVRREFVQRSSCHTFNAARTRTDSIVTINVEFRLHRQRRQRFAKIARISPLLRADKKTQERAAPTTLDRFVSFDLSDRERGALTSPS